MSDRMIEIRSGGWLTIGGRVRFFALKGRDRAFVCGLLDAIEQYEQDLTDDQIALGEASVRSGIPA